MHKMTIFLKMNSQLSRLILRMFNILNLNLKLRPRKYWAVSFIFYSLCKVNFSLHNLLSSHCHPFWENHSFDSFFALIWRRFSWQKSSRLYWCQTSLKSSLLGPGLSGFYLDDGNKNWVFLKNVNIFIRFNSRKLNIN